VELAQRGENGAFGELVERHRSMAKRVARGILRDEADAEDEVQNAFYKAFANLGGFQQDAKFSTWLNRIVVNQCLMKLRKQKRAPVVHLEELTVGDEALRLELPDQRVTPEEAFGQGEVGRILEAEIGKLPPLMRDVLVMRDVSELGMGEVAGRLGITVAAAKSRLLRARLEMKARLQQRLGLAGAGA